MANLVYDNTRYILVPCDVLGLYFVMLACCPLEGTGFVLFVLFCGTDESTLVFTLKKNFIFNNLIKEIVIAMNHYLVVA